MPMSKAELERAAGHHTRMATMHGAALAKCQEEEDETGMAFHKAAMQEHLGMASTMLECCKTCVAAELSKLSMSGDAIVPDHVSGIVGEIPVGVYPVTRFGQRQMEKTVSLDPQLEKVLGTDE